MSVVDDEPRSHGAGATDLASALMTEIAAWLIEPEDDYIGVARRVGDAFEIKRAGVRKSGSRTRWEADGKWTRVLDASTGVGPIIDPFAGVIARANPSFINAYVTPSHLHTYNEPESGTAVVLEVLRDALSPSPRGLRVVRHAPVYLLIPVTTVAKMRRAGGTAALPHGMFDAINRGYRALRTAMNGADPELKMDQDERAATVVVALPAE